MQQVVKRHPNMHGIRPFLAMFSALRANTKQHSAVDRRVKRNAEVDPERYSVASVYALELRADAFEWLSAQLPWAMRTGPASRTIRTGCCATIRASASR